MTPKKVIKKSQIKEQRLDEFWPFFLGALGGTAAGATLGDYFLQKRKGDKNWSVGQSVDRNIERGKKVYKNITGTDDDEKSKKDDKDKSDTAKSAEPTDTDIVVPPGSYPWKDTPGIHGFPPGTKFKRDELYEKSLYKVLNKYKDFLDEKNEQPQKNAFELEVEKHFSDPHTRAAIMAKARQESGAKNIGELSYANNSNNHIRTVFKGNPAIEKLSDAELSSLKKNPVAFYDTAYGHLGGYKYRGRGPIQITGKANYARIDRDLGLNGALVKDPDLLLRDPALANAASIQYLKNAGLDKKAYTNQRDAHLDVIHAIGGPSYKPGSWRSNKVYAQLIKDEGLPPKQNNAQVSVPVNKSGSGTIAQRIRRAFGFDSDAPAAPPTASKVSPKEVPPAAPPTASKVPPKEVPPAAPPTASKVPPAKTADAAPGKDKEPDKTVAVSTATVGAEPIGPTHTKLISVPPGKNFYDIFDVDAYAKSADAKDLTKFLKPDSKQIAKEQVAYKKNHKYKNGFGSKQMRNKKVPEASLAIDNAIETGKNVAGATAVGSLASQMPRIPQPLKKLGAKVLPGANIAYQAADAAERYNKGDLLGAGIAGASMIPAVAIPGMIAQELRDVAKERGGWKNLGKDVLKSIEKQPYDPSFLPENTHMKRLTNLRLSVIKEELALKKCSMTEQQINERFFFYYDGKKTIFNEDGMVIGHVSRDGQISLTEGRLDPYLQGLKSVGSGLKTGWNWAAKNIPPAYQKGKEIVGKTADEIANLYQAGKGAATAVGRELVDIPTSAAQKLKTAYQDVRYGTGPGMSPAERASHISDIQTRTQVARIEKAEADLAAAEAKANAAKAKGLGKAEVKQAEAEVAKTRAEAENLKQQARQSKAAADVAASEVPFIGPRGKQMAKIGGGTGLTLGGVDVGLQYDPEIGSVPGGYEFGKGFKQLVTPPPAPTNETTLRKKYEKFQLSEQDAQDSKTIAQKIRRALGLDQPAPAPKPTPKIQSNAANWAYSIYTGKNKPEQVPDNLRAEVQGLLNKPPANWTKPAKPEPEPAPAPAKPEPADPAYTPGTPEYDARMEKLQIDAGDKWSRERQERSAQDGQDKPDQIQTGSDKVRRVQQKLRDAGYGDLLGKFGPEGTGVDGRWGKNTQAAYDAYMADKQARQELKIKSDPYQSLTAVKPSTAATPGSEDWLRKQTANTAQSQTETEPAKSETQSLSRGLERQQRRELYRQQDLDRLMKQANEPNEPEIDEPTSDDPIGDIIHKSNWKSQNPDIKGVFESDLKDILRLAGRR